MYIDIFLQINVKGYCYFFKNMPSFNLQVIILLDFDKIFILNTKIQIEMFSLYLSFFIYVI